MAWVATSGQSRYSANAASTVCFTSSGPCKGQARRVPGHTRGLPELGLLPATRLPWQRRMQLCRTQAQVCLGGHWGPPALLLVAPLGCLPWT